MAKTHAQGIKRRAKVLHIDHDRNTFETVANVLAGIADVVSVDSIDDAHDALSAIRFDLVALEAQFTAQPDFDPHNAFRDDEGNPVRVVIFSTATTEPTSPWPTLDNLLAVVGNRLSRGRRA